MNRLARALGVALLAIAMLSAWRLATRAARRAAPPPPAPQALQDLGAVPDFALVDQEGRTVTRKDLAGRPWVAAFIFTSCRGQCPMMTRAMRELSEKLPGLRFVSFSVDPADSPADLKRFAQAYCASWTFLTGRGGEVGRLSREGFKLGVASGGGPEEPILHSNRLALVDAAGRIRGYFDGGDAAAAERLVAAAARLGP